MPAGSVSSDKKIRGGITQNARRPCPPWGGVLVDRLPIPARCALQHVGP